MLKNYKKGFTLIELLVVIAIIGILSSVVLASLNSARNKGNDAKVTAQMAGMRSAIEVYYDNQDPKSYGPSVVGSEGAIAPNFGNGCSTEMFTDTAIDPYTDTTNYPAGTTMKCTSDGASYVVSAGLPSAPATNFWCIDSSGNSKSETAVHADNATSCL